MRLGRRLLQGIARSLQKRRDEREEPDYLGQWFLLAGLQSEERRTSPDPKALTPLIPPPDAFWADPFARSVDGKRVVFCEDYSFRTRLGRISAMELDLDSAGRLRAAGEMVPVIDEPRHLSYPFLLEFDGSLYMAPESGASRRVDLYRCTGFPYAWEKAGTLLEGIAAFDATLFEHEGLWWLFCAARQDGVRPNESLFAFYADSPLARRWTPHARNPLVRDYAGARPAGRVFRDRDGRLIRPAQNCVPRYGYGLVLHQILSLSPDRYEERAIWSANGAQSGGWRGMHHLDWHDGLMVMDAQRLIQRS